MKLHFLDHFVEEIRRLGTFELLKHPFMNILTVNDEGLSSVV